MESRLGNRWKRSRKDEKVEVDTKVCLYMGNCHRSVYNTDKPDTPNTHRQPGFMIDNYWSGWSGLDWDCGCWGWWGWYGCCGCWRCEEEEENRRMIRRQSCNGSVFLYNLGTLLLWWSEGTEQVRVWIPVYRKMIDRGLEGSWGRWNTNDYVRNYCLPV